MDKIPLKRLLIGLGMNPNGQMTQASYVAAANRKLFVVPGKYAVIETSDQAGKVTVTELPLGPLGWEYEAL